MATMDLGQIINLHPGLGVNPPQTHAAIMMLVAADAAPSDKDIVDRAVADAKQIPGLWFVDFENPAINNPAGQEMLKGYMKNVQDYRSWASLVWNKTVQLEPTMPKDSDFMSSAKRSAYLAKVARAHMRATPWLALNSNTNVYKKIDCWAREFHTELITTVLKGFVDATPNIVKSLEQILEALKATIGQSKSSSENRTIICERYEYIPQANVIKSDIRIISFNITDEMKNVHNAKMTETCVACDIEYNQYEATFNNDLWLQIAAKIERDQLDAAKTFVDAQTVSCKP